MQFKTKDLLVTVLPKTEITDAQQAKFCLLRTIICTVYPTRYLCEHISCFRGSQECNNYSFATICECSRLQTCFCSFYGTRGCGFGHSCGPGGSACDPTIFCPGGSQDPFVIQDLEGLAALKTELQATLKSLDAIQKEGLPSSIGSKKDAEALERSLTEALEQVRTAKKNL